MEQNSRQGQPRGDNKNAYKNNHTIPAFMLSYWIDPATNNSGVHVYDIAKKKDYASTSRGRKPFSFAITQDLYVHNSKGVRAHALERWLAGLEGPLSAFVRRAHSRQAIVYRDMSEATRTLMGIVALEFRSRYGIHLLMKALQESPSLRIAIGAGNSAPTHQVVLENLIVLVTEMTTRFTPTEMTFSVAPRGASWLMSDRPCFHHAAFDDRFVVLTNKVLLAYRAAQCPRFRYVDVSAEHVEEMNRVIALQARDWLVSDNRVNLQKHAATYSTDEWKQAVSSDGADVIVPKFLRTGWTIND